MLLLDALVLLAACAYLAGYCHTLRNLTRPEAWQWLQARWSNRAIVVKCLVVNLATAAAGMAYIWTLLQSGDFSVGPLGLLLASPALNEISRFDDLIRPKVKHLPPLLRIEAQSGSRTPVFFAGLALWDLVRQGLHLTTPGPLILLATLIGVGLLVAQALLLPRLLGSAIRQEARHVRRAAWGLASSRVNLLFACYGLAYLATVPPLSSWLAPVHDFVQIALMVVFVLAPSFYFTLCDGKYLDLLKTNASMQQTVTLATTTPPVAASNEPLLMPVTNTPTENETVGRATR